MDKFFTEIYEQDGKFYATASDGNPIEMDYPQVVGEGIKLAIKKRQPQMKRDISRAGKVIYCHGYELRYDENGYCTARLKMN